MKTLPIPSPLSQHMLGLILLILLPTTAWAGKGTLLGPTGILGEMLTWPPPPKEFITVTMVEEGSPASGKFKKGDVIAWRHRPGGGCGGFSAGALSFLSCRIPSWKEFFVFPDLGRTAKIRKNSRSQQP